MRGRSSKSREYNVATGITVLAAGSVLWQNGQMNRDALIAILREYEAPLRANGATHLFLFGSRARGTERSDSDLDLFIDYDRTVNIPSMFRLMAVERAISAQIGVPVTITTRYALHPLMKDRIEGDAVKIV